jgi:hypothetical protein
MTLETWAEVLTGKITFATAQEAGRITITGDDKRVKKVLGAFEIGALRNV